MQNTPPFNARQLSGWADRTLIRFSQDATEWMSTGVPAVGEDFIRSSTSLPEGPLQQMVADTLRLILDSSRLQALKELERLKQQTEIPLRSSVFGQIPSLLQEQLMERYGAGPMRSDLEMHPKRHAMDAYLELQSVASKLALWRMLLCPEGKGTANLEISNQGSNEDVVASTLSLSMHTQLEPAKVDSPQVWLLTLRAKCNCDAGAVVTRIVLTEDLQKFWAKPLAKLPRLAQIMLQRLASRQVDFVPPVVLNSKRSSFTYKLKLPCVAEEAVPSIRVSSVQLRANPASNQPAQRGWRRLWKLTSAIGKRRK